MILIPRETCVDLDAALRKEWLVTNGIGGYASGTIAGVNTRRYHGLLVAALRPPVERTLLLANIDEEVEIDGRTYYLGANEYPDGKINPTGFVHLEEFRIQNGIPTALYRLGDSVLLKTVWMERGQNTTYVRYTYVEGEGECCLTLHAMCNHRDFHEMTQGDFNWDFHVEPLPGGCKVVAREGAVPFWLSTAPAAEFTHTGVWYWNFVFRREVERGYNNREDLYLPGVFRAVLQPGESVTLIASTEPLEKSEPLIADALEREQSRQRALIKTAKLRAGVDEIDAADPEAPVESFVAQLVQAADSFIVTRNVRRGGEIEVVPTVLAGYHWFTDWGRDTMIALPGLTLPTRRTREAAKAIQAYISFVRDGLLPNNFPDAGDAPQYNTADATLWLFTTVEMLATGTGSATLARAIYPALSDILAQHVKGTRYGIGMDPSDALLHAGEKGMQLTWMDAKIGDWVVTPRTGKPVEINALWYNALRVMAKLQTTLGGQVRPGKLEAPDFAALASQAREAFRDRFWYERGGYLYDVIDGPDGADASLRPNQLLALRTDGLMPTERARRSLASVREHLLTPVGLRTLSPQDPRYAPRYEGDRSQRDAVYHNGTIWTWLLGPYFDSVERIEGREAARAEFHSILPDLRKHLADAGLGTISEIFDGDAPHEPKGCISQAWSVSEVLRLTAGFEL